MNKVVRNADEAVHDIPDGASIMVGGFGLCGNPENLIRALVKKGVKNLTTISNNAGVGTVVAEKKETREFDGRLYLMEHALKADFALIKAWKGDKSGNLVYRKTARNFNPMMATAAKVTIAEVEHLVEPGQLDPDLVHTPSVFVKRIFQGDVYEKRLQNRTVRRAST